MLAVVGVFFRVDCTMDANAVGLVGAVAGATVTMVVRWLADRTADARSQKREAERRKSHDAHRLALARYERQCDGFSEYLAVVSELSSLSVGSRGGEGSTDEARIAEAGRVAERRGAALFARTCLAFGGQLGADVLHSLRLVATAGHGKTSEAAEEAARQVHLCCQRAMLDAIANTANDLGLETEVMDTSPFLLPHGFSESRQSSEVTPVMAPRVSVEPEGVPAQAVGGMDAEPLAVCGAPTTTSVSAVPSPEKAPRAASATPVPGAERRSLARSVQGRSASGNPPRPSGFGRKSPSMAGGADPAIQAAQLPSEPPASSRSEHLLRPPALGTGLAARTASAVGATVSLQNSRLPKQPPPLPTSRVTPGEATLPSSQRVAEAPFVRPKTMVPPAPEATDPLSPRVARPTTVAEGAPSGSPQAEPTVEAAPVSGVVPSEDMSAWSAVTGCGTQVDGRLMDMVKLVRSGRLTNDSPVRKTGMASYHPAAKFEELKTVLPESNPSGTATRFAR